MSIATAGTPEPDAGRDGWALRFGGCVAIGVGLRSHETLSATGVGLWAGVTLVLVAIFVCCRFETHRELHEYWAWGSWAARGLSVAFVGEGLLAMMALSAGPFVLFAAAHERATRGFWSGLVLFAAYAANAVLMSRLVKRLERTRGCMVAPRHCRLARVAEGVCETLHLDAVARELKRETDIDQISAFVFWILAVLLAVVVACAPGSEDEPGRDRRSGGSAAVPLVQSILGHLKEVTPKPPKRPKDPGTSPTPSPTATAAPADPKMPQYDDICGPYAMPGRGAPAAPGTTLNELWFGPGAVYAGCASPARLLLGSWVETGICDGDLRSLAVIAPDGSTALVYSPVAGFVLRHARHGTLRRVADQRLAGTGGFYVEETDAGTWVFARRSGPGPAADDALPSSCGEIRTPGYVRVPPALVRLWVDSMDARDEWLWPVWSGVKAKLRTVRFISDDPASEDEFVGRCTNATSCVLSGPDGAARASGEGAVKVQRIDEHAPPMPGHSAP